jgi:hypothetical protein
MEEGAWYGNIAEDEERTRECEQAIEGVAEILLIRDAAWDWTE